MPVISTIPVCDDHIDHKPRVTIYYGDDRYMISAREKWVADRFIQMVQEGKVNYSLIARELREKFGNGRTHVRYDHIMYWLKRERTNKYLNDRLEVLGYGKEELKKDLLDAAKGRNNLTKPQMFALNQLARMEGIGDVGIHVNTQINFTQSDGTI
jgi:hypothetical protein